MQWDVANMTGRQDRKAAWLLFSNLPYNVKSLKKQCSTSIYWQ